MIDQRQIRHAFTRAAVGYDSGDFLHREVRERLLERLQAITANPSWIIDLGAGTGGATPGLRARFPTAQILSIDSSAAMLKAGKDTQQSLCADAACLPLADGCADLLVSNLMLHHCPDPATVLTEARRVLSTQGFMVLTTLGRRSFIELGRAWASADQFTHITPFFDLQELGNLLTTTGFTEPVLDIQTLTVTYDTLAKMMGDLRSAGSTNATDGRNHGLTGRTTWQQLTAAYDQLRDADGKLPVTLEIIFVLAWAGKNRGEGEEIAIPVDSIRRMSRNPLR